jgi:hypothetical protein
VSPDRYLGAVRVLLVGLGLSVFVYALDMVGFTPIPSPERGGHVVGMAYLFSVVVGAAGFLLALVGYALPPGTDPVVEGPLGARSAGTRAGVQAVGALVTGLVLLFAVPEVVPGLSGTAAFVSGVLALVVGGVLGVPLALLFTLSGLLLRTYRSRRGARVGADG